ncbi:MAG TPA: D-amino acid aminotransferase, partial [Gammaproteobacteria bacterium]|nr:D-amino acid aminotransferase [Gammaproteobacteria bacterium]
MTRCVYVNGKFLQRRNAKVDIEDRGFNFGDAVYEVIFLNNDILVDEEEHLNRLEYSLSEL